MTCQIMLFIMYIGGVRMTAKYIESDKMCFAVPVWTSNIIFTGEKPLDTFFKEEAN